MNPHNLGRSVFGDPKNADNLMPLEEAHTLLNEWVPNEKLRLHMKQVAANMKAWALEKENLPGVWRDLGMPSGHAYSKAFRTCKTCVGTEFCRFGVGDSTGLGIEIEKKFSSGSIDNSIDKLSFGNLLVWNYKTMCNINLHKYDLHLMIRYGENE